MKKLIWTQFYLLLAGTLFAWFNFSIEFKDWINNEACTLGCSAGNEVVNPFITPCFYGAIFFLLSFVLSCFILREFNKANNIKQ